jgi:chorismate mutase/prephenate dehydratase
MNFDEVQNIAYLGPQASFTEMAKDYFCEKYNINAYPCAMQTVRQVVEYVDNNPGVPGVLPLENAVEGTVRESLDSLLKTKNPNIRVLSEHIMPVNYCLLARTTEISSISNIIAPPQVLAQCSEFISNEMPMNINTTEAASTAEAAKLLQNYNLTYAAIGSVKTAETYMLNILKENINDEKTNSTRFALIGDFETNITGHDRTSLAFSTENKPGTLLRVLEIFLKNKINLSYIVSRPAQTNASGYIFFVNFDGHINDPHMLQTINEIKSKTTYLRFLGSFTRI